MIRVVGGILRKTKIRAAILGMIFLAAITPAIANHDAIFGHHSIIGPALLSWEARFDGPASEGDAGRVLDVSPDGSRMFVSGTSRGLGTGNDYATVSYDAASGTELWVSRFDGVAGTTDLVHGLSVSPDGSRVFVTGQSQSLTMGTQYATISYNSATGAELWVGLFGRDAVPAAIGVSPDNSRVFVTGRNRGRSFEYATVAYDATNGDELWVTKFDSPIQGDDVPTALGVSPDGTLVFVTGRGKGQANDYLTVAYDAANGTEQWNARFNGVGSGASNDLALDLGVSPDGSRVFVTGLSPTLGTTSSDFVTIAYSATSGGQLWVSRFNGPAGLSDRGRSLSVSPDGSKVFVMGESQGPAGAPTLNFTTTVAYNAANGMELWVSSFDQGASVLVVDGPFDIDVSPDGKLVYVTGQTDSVRDYATVAYDADSGAKQWEAHFDGPVNGTDRARALGVSHDGSRVFVTGGSSGSDSGSDYATIAYDANPEIRDVEIDIKPGSDPNSINLGSNGSVPVAILSTAEFDATTVDPVTITLASATVKLKGRGTPMTSFKDINGDDVLDLVVHIETEALQVSETAQEVVLFGLISNSTTFIRGVDTIKVVP